MSGADEQTAGGEHLAIEAQRQVGRAAADIEIQDRRRGMRLRQAVAIAHEGQPRFEPRIVGRGVTESPVPSTRRWPAFFARRQARDERSAAEDFGMVADSASQASKVDRAPASMRSPSKV
jgi:hypothetical protein